MGACYARYEDCCIGCLKNVAMTFGRLFQIEELTARAVLEEDQVITGLKGGTIIALMRESQQMLSLIKFCGYYMLLLTLIYLGLTIY